MTKDTGPARLPALPPVNAQDPALRNWMRAVAERLEVREGSRGNPYERAVTVREMVGLGLAGVGGRGDMVAASAIGGASAQQQAGYYGDMSADAFAEAIRNSKLYQGLIKRLDDATRFDDLPEQVRAILLVDIADEARKRQADIRTLQYKLQTATNSLAYQLTEVTAAVEGAAAGVREMTFASATRDAATAGKVTQVQARIDGVPIPPERILPTVYASLGALTAAVPKPAQARYYQVADAGGGENLLYRWNGAAWVLSGKGTTASATATLEETAIATADRIKGLSAEKTIKVQAGNKVAGIGLSATEDPEGNGDSAFIVMADRFAIVSADDVFADPNNPPASRIPFGVDTVANVIYMNGQVRIGNSSKTIVDLVEDVDAIAVDGPINFIGSFLTPPATFSLRKGSVYRNDSNGNSYILDANGGTWKIYLEKGAPGTPGSPGSPGSPGAPGAPGAPGSNGAASVTATTTAASAAAVTNADLNGAIVAALGRASAAGDAVTLANPTAKWSDSWIRRASVWERVTLYIDGNALITGTLFASTLSTQKVIIRPIGVYSATSLAISGGEVQVTLTTNSAVATPLWSHALAPPTGTIVTVVWFGSTSNTCTFLVRAFSVATGAAYTGTIPKLNIWMF